MECHEVALLFPEMEPEAFKQLAADIGTHGLLEPIVIYQGKIVDGRHRHRACQLTGTEPVFRTWDGRGSLVSFVVSLNLSRRHLTSSQRAVIALDIEPLLTKEAKERQRHSGGDQTAKVFRTLLAGGEGAVPQLVAEPLPHEEISGTNESQREFDETRARIGREAAEQVARLLQTNRVYIRAAKEIRAKAPDLLEKVRAGTIGIKDAKVFARIQDSSQRQLALHHLETGVVKTARAAAMALSKTKEGVKTPQAKSKPVVECASWESWLPTQPVGDLLLTDPPYLTEIPDMRSFATSWLPLALSSVKSTGRAYVFIGAYKEELLAYLDLCERRELPLQLQQLLVWSYKNTLGPKPSHRYKQNWQAILYFCGEDAPPLNCPTLTELFSVQEVNAPDGRVGQRYHRWQKPDVLAEMLIRHSTRPGDLVLDPFCGTGTFVLAAQRLGREGRGCDHSSEMLEIAQRRGCLIKDATASLLASSQPAREQEKWA